MLSSADFKTLPFDESVEALLEDFSNDEASDDEESDSIVGKSYHGSKFPEEIPSGSTTATIAPKRKRNVVRS